MNGNGENKKRFKILSIDGGGIRGIFPAKYLSSIENYLISENRKETSIYQYFDLICGTSTGGILAIGLSLGMPANDILSLYFKHANEIFGNRRNFIVQFLYPKYSHINLERLIKDSFSKCTNSQEPKLGDAKTRLCIPVFDILNGKPNILKTSHHEDLHIDCHIPAYQAAVASASAPLFFSPYPIKFQPKQSTRYEMHGIKVDGGVFANNPSMIGLLEANKGLGINLEDIELLSLGTGRKEFSDTSHNRKWGIYDWLKNKKIIELFFEAQSESIENYLKIFHSGIGKGNQEGIKYFRVQHTFKTKLESIRMDETKQKHLNRLEAYAVQAFKNSGKEVIDLFFNEPANKFEPVHKI